MWNVFWWYWFNPILNFSENGYLEFQEYPNILADKSIFQLLIDYSKSTDIIGGKLFDGNSKF